MTIGAYILFAIILGVVILAIRHQRKQGKEELHYKNVSFKALRLSELHDIIGDPSKSEKMRDSARDEIKRRFKHKLI